MTLVRSRLTHSPLVYGGGIRKVAAQPASIVFNGTDEYLARAVSTSGANATTLTISIWSKATAADTTYLFLQSLVTADVTFLSRFIATGTEQLAWQASDGTQTITSQSVTAADQYEEDGTWNHYVLRYDSTQGTTADRIRIYRNGTQISDTQSPDVSLNEVHYLFRNGNDLYLGSSNTVFTTHKIAFIDVLEGVDAAPTAFAFDDGGTWTRMPYAGSYGTYGFNVDGTDGFNDVSGNGQNFTGTNMDASNLDTADLPPYTA